MIKEIILNNADDKIPVSILRSERKTLGLEIRLEGEVLVRVPQKLSDEKIEKFINEHQEWIFKKYYYQKNNAIDKKHIEINDWDNLTKFEIEQIKKEFYKRVEYYSKIMEVTYEKITIRNQKTRWGSCSSKGNLNFNYRLFYLPKELLDYVVIHELAHRKFMNHSKAFWNEVERYCPNYLFLRKELKKYSI